MTSRVSGKNKEKKAKRKNIFEKNRPKRKKKKRYKETENSVAGSLHVQATTWPLHHSDTHDLKN